MADRRRIDPVAINLVHLGAEHLVKLFLLRYLCLFLGELGLRYVPWHHASMGVSRPNAVRR